LWHSSHLRLQSLSISSRSSAVITPNFNLTHSLDFLVTDIYADDVHSLPFHNEEVHQKIVNWFRQYMK